MTRMFDYVYGVLYLILGLINLANMLPALDGVGVGGTLGAYLILSYSLVAAIYLFYSLSYSDKIYSSAIIGALLSPIVIGVAFLNLGVMLYTGVMCLFAFKIETVKFYKKHKSVDLNTVKESYLEKYGEIVEDTDTKETQETTIPKELLEGFNPNEEIILDTGKAEVDYDKLNQIDKNDSLLALMPEEISLDLLLDDSDEDTYTPIIGIGTFKEDKQPHNQFSNTAKSNNSNTTKNNNSYTAKNNDSYTAKNNDSYTAKSNDSHTAKSNDSYTAKREKRRETRQESVYTKPSIVANLDTLSLDDISVDDISLDDILGVPEEDEVIKDFSLDDIEDISLDDLLDD